MDKNDKKSTRVKERFGWVRYGFICSSWMLNDSLAWQELMVLFRHSETKLAKSTTCNWLKCSDWNVRISLYTH